MGYIYSQHGGMLCDLCGGPGATKQRCPFGYCQPIAACKDCRKAHASEFGRAAHRAHGCEREHLRFVAEQAERAAALASGDFVLVSALSADNGMVHAIFAGKDGKRGKLIQRAIYDQRVNFAECMTIGRFERLAGNSLPDAAPSFY